MSQICIHIATFILVLATSAYQNRYAYADDTGPHARNMRQGIVVCAMRTGPHAQKKAPKHRGLGSPFEGRARARDAQNRHQNKIWGSGHAYGEHLAFIKADGSGSIKTPRFGQSV